MHTDASIPAPISSDAIWREIKDAGVEKKRKNQCQKHQGQQVGPETSHRCAGTQTATEVSKALPTIRTLLLSVTPPIRSLWAR